MMELGDDTLCNEERIVRLVLSPNDVDEETGLPLQAFISLRKNEKGISFLRLDLIGKDAVIANGKDREAKFNFNHEEKNTFVGWLQGIVGDIRAIDPQVIRIVVNNLEKKPEHAEIRFHKDGELVRGIVTDAQILDILDEIYHTLEYVIV